MDLCYLDAAYRNFWHVDPSTKGLSTNRTGDDSVYRYGSSGGRFSPVLLSTLPMTEMPSIGWLEDVRVTAVWFCLDSVVV